MVFTIKLDAKSAVLYFSYLFIAFAALAFAFPRLRTFFPGDSSSLASWMQAFGSILAIFATWYIASAQQRVSREKEYRLAALEASIMHAELRSVMISFGKISTKLITMRLNNNFKSLESIALGLQEINIRPLSEQKDLALVGTSYLSEISEILRLQSILGSDIGVLRILLPQDAGAFLFGFNEVIECSQEIERRCDNASKILKSFAAEQSITLNHLY